MKSSGRPTGMDRYTFDMDAPAPDDQGFYTARVISRTEKSGCCSCCGKKKKPTGNGPQKVYDKRNDTTCCSPCCRKKKSSCLCSPCCRKQPKTDVIESQTKSSRKEKCVHCCKKFIAFLFSHIGLCSLVAGYSALGGFIFMKLEAPFEETQRDFVAKLRLEYVQELWEATQRLNVLHKENWTIVAEEVFIEFQQMVYEATKFKGWDGKDGSTDLQWSFAGSLLYSITVITTIGYGNIAPKTDNGRIVTIFYALFGIPLTLLCLAHFGSFLGDCLRLLYKQSCKCCYWIFCPRKNRKTVRMRRRVNAEEEERNPLRKGGMNNDVEKAEYVLTMTENEDPPVKEEKQTRVPIIVTIMIIAGYIFGGAVLFSLWEEDWDYLIGSYFCFITLSTVGFGDVVLGSSLRSGSDEKLIICCLYMFFGLSLMAMGFNLMQEEVRYKFALLGKKLGLLDERRKR